MFGRERIYTGVSEEFLQNNTANTELGRIVRSADANKFLAAMAEHEATVLSRETEINSCTNRIEAMVVQHRLSAEYLISFGVPAEHRSELRTVMEEASQTGGLSLQAAIELANARSSQLQLEG